METGKQVCVEGRSASPLGSSKNSLERIPQTIEQYKEKNAALAKDIPLLKEIANKQWKKEYELKGLKSELAALDRKIQLELAKNKALLDEFQRRGIDTSAVSDGKAISFAHPIRYDLPNNRLVTVA